MTDPVDDQTFDIAIGRIVRVAAVLEAELVHVHSHLTGSPLADAITAGLTVEQTLQGINRLAAAAAEATPDHKPTMDVSLHNLIKEVTKTVRDLMQQRHAVIHGSWRAPSDDPTARITYLRRRSAVTETTWTLESLRELQDGLSSAFLDTYTVLFELQTGESHIAEVRRIAEARRITGRDPL